MDGVVYGPKNEALGVGADVRPDEHLDYAFLPIDGIYNMDAKEAAHCAKIIGAKQNVPVHMKPGELFSQQMAESFDADNRLIVKPGQTICW